MSSTEMNAPVLPDQFGPYRIVRPLGKGGMGAVYLAHDTRLDRDVALKVCTLADDATALERFRREAKAAAALAHQHLCPVFEFDVRDGIAYLTMAYVEGPTLNAWVAKRGGISQRDAARLIAKLALAMQAAHDAGIVHRDLKPANIVMNQKGEPVILDFGLARQMADSRTRLTQVGAIYGTPSYMAPEQAGGDPELIGPASDVYALGVILYELLAGRVPFEGPLTAVIGQLLGAAPAAPRSFNPLVDPALEAICLKALGKKPADRPRNMREFARSLAKVAPNLSAAAAVPDQRTKPTASASDATSPEAPVVNKPPSSHPPVRDVIAVPVAMPVKRGSPPPLPSTAAPSRSRGSRADTWVQPVHESDAGNRTAWIVGGISAALVLLAGIITLVLVLRRDSSDGDTDSSSGGESSVTIAANRTQSQNNLKQIGLALHSYHDVYNVLPPATIRHPQTGATCSWRVAILPYIEEAPLYNEWKFDESWDGPNNRKLWTRMPKIYRLPGPSGDSTRTHYQVFSGQGTMFEDANGVRLADVTDGTSNTIMAIEAKDPVLWCAPDDIPFTQSPDGLDPRGFGGHFGDSAQVLLGDGFVRSVAYTMTPLDFQSAITRNGNELFTWP